MAHYRILYHHRTQALDGQRVHIHEIQRALRAMGHAVVEVAPLPADEPAGGVARRGLRRRLLSTIAEHTPPGVYELLELAYNVPAYVRLSRAIRRVRPDFIYERYSLNTAAGVWAARRFGIPLLLEVNAPLAEEKRRLGKLVFHRIARRLERHVVRQATRTLAVTNVLKDRLVAQTGVATDRVVVVPNGVDPARFDRAAAQRAEVRRRLGVGGEVLIGAVGFFREWHGIDLLLRALYADPSLQWATRVLLVGDGPAVPDLQRLARTLRLERRAIVLGSVPHDEVPPLVAALDVVLIPRAVEYASPLKLFEYMAAGKAIVAPRQRNLQEVLTDDVDAIFFAPEHLEMLRAALARVVFDGALRRRLGEAARRTIERRRLTWEGSAARIVETFEESIGAAAAPAVLAGSRA